MSFLLTVPERMRARSSCERVFTVIGMTQRKSLKEWHLQGYQEARLRDFQRLLQMDRGLCSFMS
jgi:hypothetical protein